MKYTGQKLKEISFPLGGIGTGSIGLAGNGGLVDFEIFNRPGKGRTNKYTHFAVRAIDGDTVNSRILNGDLLKDFTGQYKVVQPFTGFGHGYDYESMCGFPHFKDVEFDGKFPIAELNFRDKNFPANITLNAFNPLIPGNALDSSIPSAFFEVCLENTTDRELKYQVAFSVTNPYEVSKNESIKKDGKVGVRLKRGDVDPSDTEYGELTVMTDNTNAFAETYWYRGDMHDSVVTFWNEFSREKSINNRTYDSCGKLDTCTVFAEVTLAPCQKGSVRFVLSWSVPYMYNYWSGEEAASKRWKNYYATVFDDSLESASYSVENFDKLYEKTREFTDALHTSTLPGEVLDAASANLSVLKSPTVFRLEDGTFYGFEGVHERSGSCEGTCQHVWNYAYALCFLFPDLERSIRDAEFKYSLDKDGRMGFRLMLPLGSDIIGFRACLDGQMGAVIKSYREWKISGNNEWLASNWDNIKSALEYAWSEDNPDAWDRDRDGVLEGRQHHTLDIELFGPSSWLEGLYLAALKAASEMARFLGDNEKADEYENIFERGKKWMNENLFNGKYFNQKVDITDKSIVERFNAEHFWNEETGQIKYQIADGSAIDQMLAQWHADIIGLGEIFDSDKVSLALDEMMKNNYKESMRDFANPWRIYAINDESSSIICSYPDKTKKPAIPIPYCEESMTGFEYAFAGLLCSRGKIDDGLKVTRAVRDRFDGEKRNPWNEFECGSNYARSMASYALIPILSGFEFDMPHGHIGFSPYVNGDFKSVWSLDGAWGTFEKHADTASVNITDGALTLSSLGMRAEQNVSGLTIDGKDVDFTFKDGVINFEKTKVSTDIVVKL